MSTEGIDESLHGLGGIEEFLSKNGVFSRTKKRQFEARESEGFSTRLDGLGAPQGVTKTTRTNSSPCAQESTTKIEIQPNKARNGKDLDEIKTPEGTRRIGPPFPINLSTKSSQFHDKNPYL